MNLTSCDNCGVVVDRDKICFPYRIQNSDGSYDLDKCQWSELRQNYIPTVPCPICKTRIQQTN